jgi:outer membrane protein TolC
VVLEDLQAQEDLTLSQANYLDVIAEYDKAQYALVKATGGLTEGEKAGAANAGPAP